MSDIRKFVAERVAEDRAVATDAIDTSGYYSSPSGEWRFIHVDYEGEWPMNPDREYGAESAYSEWALHASRFDPARVLAECDLKDALLAMHITVYEKNREFHEQWNKTHPFKKMSWEPEENQACVGCNATFQEEYTTENIEDCPTLRALAAVYSDHEDYDKNWAVSL